MLLNIFIYICLLISYLHTLGILRYINRGAQSTELVWILDFKQILLLLLLFTKVVKRMICLGFVTYCRIFYCLLFNINEIVTYTCTILK